MEGMTMNTSYLQKAVITAISFLFIGSFLAGSAECEKEEIVQKEPFTTPFTAPKAYEPLRKIPEERKVRKTDFRSGEFASLRRELERQKRMVVARDAEIERSLKEIEALERELDNTQKILALQQGKSKSKYKDEIASLHNEVKNLHDDLRDSQNQLNKMRQKHAAIEAEKASLEKESAAYHQMLKQALAEDIQQGRVSIFADQGILTLSAQNMSIFDSGSSAPNEGGRSFLERVSDVLKKAHDRDIQIEGYADSNQISGILMDKYATNWELSTARATAVVRYLVEKADINPTRISAVGYGESHPVASNATPEGRAFNRRVNIVLLPMKKQTGY
jgi:chemotaxis protein MotB